MTQTFMQALRKKKTAAPKKLIAVRIPIEIESAIRKIAKDNKLTVSEVIVEALRYSLQPRKKLKDTNK